MDSRCSARPSESQVEALLRQPLMGWPEAAPVVLRSTHDEVLDDVARVLDEIERFLKERRRPAARET